MLISLAHTDINQKLSAENHSKVKQFDKEGILARFKSADSSTTSVALLVFLSANTILKNFVAPEDKHLTRITSVTLLESTAGVKHEKGYYTSPFPSHQPTQ